MNNEYYIYDDDEDDDDDDDDDVDDNDDVDDDDDDDDDDDNDITWHCLACWMNTGHRGWSARMADSAPRNRQFVHRDPESLQPSSAAAVAGGHWSYHTLLPSALRSQHH